MLRRVLTGLIAGALALGTVVADDTRPTVFSNYSERVKSRYAAQMQRVEQTRLSVTADYVVTSAADLPDDSIQDGIFNPPTLRAALQNISEFGSGTITFDPSITIIQPVDPLPFALNTVVIDGENNGLGSRVIIDGLLQDTTLIGISQYGMGTTGPNSIIRSLEIRNFPSGGIALNPGASGSTIQNCLIHNNDGPGILTNEVTGVLIGGLSLFVDESNTIWGQTGPGGDGIQLFISIGGGGSDSNAVIGNIIGSPDGLIRGMGNERDGIDLTGSGNIISNNLISGNDGNGIQLSDDDLNPGAFNLIEMNFIGLNIDGLDSLGNGDVGGDGITASYSSFDTVRLNTITASKTYGLELASADGCVGWHIYENTFGFAIDSSQIFGNGNVGVFPRGNNHLIEENVVIGSSTAISLQGDSNRVVSNLLGAIDTATLARFPAPQFNGISVSGADNVIGGEFVTDANIIGGGLRGISLSGSGATGNKIQNNILGIDPSAFEVTGFSLFAIQILNGASDNTIALNQVGGADSAGIYITGPPTLQPRNNLIVSNAIGTDFLLSGVYPNGRGILILNHGPTEIGLVSVGNFIYNSIFHGIHVSADSCVIAGNGISDNGGNGIFVSDSSLAAEILGNVIERNDSNGIRIVDAYDVRVGDTSSTFANTVRTNGVAGIRVGGNVGDPLRTDIRNNDVFNNLGTGMALLADSLIVRDNDVYGNLSYGVELFSRLTTFEDNEITGSASDGLRIVGDSNLIDDNIVDSNGAAGVTVDGTQNTIQGCSIYDNNGPGIELTADSTDINNNVISYNAEQGVLVTSGLYNKIIQNSISNHANGLSIDLDPTGVALNDTLDADTGPNMLQNFPVITEAIVSSPGGVPNTNVLGELKSTPNTSFRVDFYASVDCGFEFHGDADDWLGSRTIVTDGDGIGLIDINLIYDFDEFFEVLTATATDPDGNTSEVSLCFPTNAMTTDLQLTKVASMDTVQLGMSVHYDVTGINLGPSTATNMSILDNVPDEFTVDSTTSVGMDSCVVTGNTVQCFRATFLTDDTASVRIFVTADTIASTTNSAGIGSSTSDSDPLNNIDSAAVEIINVITDVGDDFPNGLPTAYALEQNYPNPFNPSTLITFALPEPADVRLIVLNVLGQTVATLRDMRLGAGSYTVEWNGRDASGRTAATGVYFYRLEAGTFVQTKKMLLLR